MGEKCRDLYVEFQFVHKSPRFSCCRFGCFLFLFFFIFLFSSPGEFFSFSSPDEFSSFSSTFRERCVGMIIKKRGEKE